MILSESNASLQEHVDVTKKSITFIARQWPSAWVWPSPCQTEPALITALQGSVYQMSQMRRLCPTKNQKRKTGYSDYDLSYPYGFAKALSISKWGGVATLKGKGKLSTFFFGWIDLTTNEKMEMDWFWWRGSKILFTRWANGGGAWCSLQYIIWSLICCNCEFVTGLWFIALLLRWIFKALKEIILFWYWWWSNYGKVLV